MTNQVDDEVTGRVYTEVGPWALVPVWALSKKLTPSELVVYVALRSFADRQGAAFPTHARIAERANLAKGTVRNAIQGLRKKKMVVTEERRRPDGSLAGLDYYLPDIDPDPDTEPEPRRKGAKPGRKPGGKPGPEGGAPGNAPPSSEPENTPGGSPGNADPRAPGNAGPTTNWCTQKKNTPENTPALEHTNLSSPSEKPDAHVDHGQTTIDGTTEPPAEKREPTNHDIAWGIANRWIAAWRDKNLPVTHRAPGHAIKMLVEKCLDNGCTEDEVRKALTAFWRRDPIPSQQAFQRAILDVREGRKPDPTARSGARSEMRDASLRVNDQWAHVRPPERSEAAGRAGW